MYSDSQFLYEMSMFFRGMVLGTLILSGPLWAAELNFNFPGLRVGTAEYSAGPTGCTVLHFSNGARGAVDIRGGAAAVRESSSLSEENSSGWIDALVFAGGSTFGLEAASGVAREILKERQSVGFDAIPIVPSAIVYDFRHRDNQLFPDLNLGSEAFQKARENRVSTGRVGAGANITAGKVLGSRYAEFSGQGAAFFESGPYKFFALTIVNPLGNILNLDGKIILGSKDPVTGERLDISTEVRKLPLSREEKTLEGGNTTLSVLVTNAPLTRGELKRLAIAAHTGMGRVIDPFHTPADGDTFFAISTASEEEVRHRKNLRLDRVAVVATSLMREAVLNAVASSKNENSCENSL